MQELAPLERGVKKGGGYFDIFDDLRLADSILGRDNYTLSVFWVRSWRMVRG